MPSSSSSSPITYLFIALSTLLIITAPCCNANDIESTVRQGDTSHTSTRPTTIERFSLPDVSGTSNFEWTLQSLHTYPDMSVGLVSYSSKTPSELKLDSRVRRVRLAAGSTVLITRAHRMTRRVRWSVSIEGVDTTYKISSVKEMKNSHSNLFVLMKIKGRQQIVLMKMRSSNGNVMWMKYMDSEKYLTTYLKWSLPEILMISKVSSNQLEFIKASTSESLSINNNNGKGLIDLKNNNYKLINYDINNGTACFIFKKDVISTSAQPTSKLYMSCTTLSSSSSSSSNNPITSTSLIELSSVVSTAHTFPQYASIVVGKSNMKKTCAQQASIMYEQAFNFDWHSRERNSSNPPRHELIINHYCITPTIQQLSSKIVRFPTTSCTGDDNSFFNGPKVNIFNNHIRYGRYENRLIMLFSTHVPLSGQFERRERNRNIIDLTCGTNQNQPDNNNNNNNNNNDNDNGSKLLTRTWLFISATYKYKHAFNLIPIGTDKQLVQNIIAQHKGIYDSLNVQAFDVTTSTTKMVVGGWLKGNNKNSSQLKSSGPLFTHTFKIPMN